MPLYSVVGEVCTLGALRLWSPWTGSYTTDISGRIDSLPGRGEPDQLTRGGLKTPPSPDHLLLPVTLSEPSCLRVSSGYGSFPIPSHAAWCLWLPQSIHDQ